MKLAVSGKGGVGKTTIAAALIKYLARTCQAVYAIDGDPDACLAAAIGIPDSEAESIKPVAEMKDVIKAKSGEGMIYTLNPKVDDVLDDYCYRHGAIRFFRMGSVKKGGSECYCRESTFLHALVSSLLLDRNEAVVMDMSAGIEHLTRGTAGGVDLMMVVVEPNRNSINTARLVIQMARDLGIRKVAVVGNKIRSEKDKGYISGFFSPDELIGFVGFSDDLLERSRDSGAVGVNEDELDGIKEVYERIIR